MDKSKTDNIKTFGNALKNVVTRKAGSYLFKSAYIFFLLVFMSCNSQQKNRSMKDPIPYLHELDSNPNYEIVTLIPKDYQLMDPNDQYDFSNKFFFDTEKKHIIVKGKKDLSSNQADFMALKIDTNGDSEKTQTIINLINNGYFFRRNKYSSWIIDNDSTLKDFKQLLSTDDRSDIEKWLPKFDEAYNKASYAIKNGSSYFLLIDDDDWFILDGIKTYEKTDDYTIDLAETHPTKNPPGRMMVLEDITPDFLNDKVDTSLIELLGYGQEYFEKGEGMNPINGSAGHYYFALKMKNDTLKFKRFGTMHPNLWVYKIPEELGGHPDVVFIVQEYNRMFPNQEFGGMYVVRPKDISKSKVD